MRCEYKVFLWRKYSFILMAIVFFLLTISLLSKCFELEPAVALGSDPNWQNIRDSIFAPPPTFETKNIGFDEWEVFYLALCLTESNGNPLAIGKTKDAGIIQITPIYVADVNRIVGYDKYTLIDRFCPFKSREMFEIKNRHYNPDRDIDKAIKIHNPRAGLSYSLSIKRNMELIKGVF